MTSFVLVHGGWHGGWCWDAVARLLRAEGHAVLAPTLTGLAERAHLIDAVTGPDTHVEDVVQAILWAELRDITLEKQWCPQRDSNPCCQLERLES